MACRINTVDTGCPSRAHDVLITVRRDDAGRMTQTLEVVEACDHIVDVCRIPSPSAAEIVEKCGAFANDLAFSWSLCGKISLEGSWTRLG